MKNLNDLIIEEYNNLREKKLLAESFVELFYESTENIELTDIYIDLLENEVLEDSNPLIILLESYLFESKEDPKKKKMEAITKKSDAVKDKIDKLKLAKEKSENSVKKAELNKQVIINRKELSKMNLENAKLGDKDTGPAKERLAKLEKAEKKADEIITIRKEIDKYKSAEGESEDGTSNDTKVKVLKTLSAKKSLELKQITSKEENPEITKKLKEVDQKLNDQVDKAKGEKGEEGEGDSKSKDVQKLELEIENLESMIKNSKSNEDDLLDAQKSKSDLLADSDRLKAYLSKKRLEHKIEFSKMIIKMIQNSEQKDFMSKKTEEMEKKNSELENKMKKMEDAMQDNADKNASPEDKEKIEKSKSDNEKISQAEDELEKNVNAEGDKPEGEETQPETSQKVSNEPEGEPKPDEKDSKQPETSQVVKTETPEEEEDEKKKKEAKESMDEIFKLKDQINEDSPLFDSLLKIEESIKNQDDLWAIKIAINNIKNQL